MLPVLTCHHAPEQSGLFSFGKQGQSHLGYSETGFADEKSACWANYLVGNSFNSPVIELSMGSAEFLCHQQTQIAITGAQCRIEINGRQQSSWRTLEIESGQYLKLHFSESGIRKYLAVRGLAKTNCLNPCFNEGDSHNILNNMFFQTDLAPCQPRLTPRRYIPNYRLPVMLNLIPSLQHEHFSETCKRQFFNSVFSIHKDSNRMGYRLNETLEDIPELSMTSQGVEYGSVQITPQGQPIILMKEHQTMGGYPQIGCVARMDLGRLAQLRPGQLCQFRRSNFFEEIRRLKQCLTFFNR